MIILFALMYENEYVKVKMFFYLNNRHFNSKKVRLNSMLWCANILTQLARAACKMFFVIPYRCITNSTVSTACSSLKRPSYVFIKELIHLKVHDIEKYHIQRTLPVTINNCCYLFTVTAVCIR